MQLKTMLNRVEHCKSFVYSEARMVDTGGLTDQQTVKLQELVKHNLRSVRARLISGGTLQFNNYASNLSFDNIANLGLGAAVGTASTLRGTITGSSGLTYVGPGTLILAGSNSYTGGTTVTNGTLNVGLNTGSGTLSSGPLSILNTSSVNAYNNLSVGGLSGDAGTTLNVANTSTLSVNQTGTGTFNGNLVLGSATGLTVNSGTVALNVASASIGFIAPTATVASNATLQLTGSVSALSDTSGNGNLANVFTIGTGSATDGAFTVVGTTNQTVGTVTGTHSTISDGSNPADVYAGNTTVGDGTNAASLTANQILQNTLTINANSTVTIVPSAGSQGGATVAGSTAALAVASSVSADSGTDSSVDSNSDPIVAIQAAIDSGSISSATGQRLENRIAAIERLATTDPGLDVSLLESRILAALPTTESAPLGDSGSGLLAVDNSTFGSGSSGASVAFASGASFGGSPAAVPEPSTLLMAVLGGIGLVLAARRRPSRQSS